MKTADYYFHNTTKMRELQPVLCVVAGPNGSGKTSTTEKLLANEWTADSLYINPDNIAQEEFGDWNSQNAVLKAAQKATQLRYDCLEISELSLHPPYIHSHQKCLTAHFCLRIRYN